MASRPTHKELTGKLRQAAEALDSGYFQIVEEERHFQDDMEVLESSSTTEHLEKVRAFLDEIISSGGADCYVGRYPPYECYHKPFDGIELFPFAWESETVGCKMYLKFGIKISKKSKQLNFIYLNCHEDAPEKKDR